MTTRIVAKPRSKLAEWLRVEEVMKLRPEPYTAPRIIVIGERFSHSVNPVALEHALASELRPQKQHLSDKY